MRSTLCSLFLTTCAAFTFAFSGDGSVLRDGDTACEARCKAHVCVGLMLCELQCRSKEGGLVRAWRCPRIRTSYSSHGDIFAALNMLHWHVSGPFSSKLLGCSAMRVHFGASRNLVVGTWLIKAQATHAKMLRAQGRDAIPCIVESLLLRFVVGGWEVVIAGTVARAVRRRRLENILGVGINVIRE